MTELKDIKVPPSFALSADQADFYRRGRRDAEQRKPPASMEGYSPALSMAYYCGGISLITEPNYIVDVNKMVVAPA